MPNNWKTYKLGEVLNSANTGLDAIKRAPIVEENTGVKCLRIQDVSQRKAFKDWGFCEVTQNNYEKFSLNKDEIIIARTGNTIGVNMFIEENLKSVFNNGLIRLRVNKDLCFPKYVYYNFRNKRFVDYINGIAYGTSTQPNMQINSLLSFEFLAPPIQEQKSIAQILSTIDDKIENNLAINKTLEEMAMVLYKHWFVDFGPFQDGEFVDSELGKIPEGWVIGKLDDLIEILSKGTTPRMKDVEGLKRKVPFLKVKDINSDGEININNLELIPEEVHLKDLKRSILLENDLLFSIAGTIGRVSIVTEKLDNSNCNQALAFIRLKQKEKFKSLIYYWLKSDEIQNRIQNAVVQGVQANVSLTVLKELQMIVPTIDIIDSFANKVNPILELVLQNQKENQILSKQRDTLLPKLISGEVRLKEFRES